MSTFNKILLGIFLFFAVVVIGEVAYLFLLSNRPTPPTANQTSLPQIMPTDLPTPTVSQSSPSAKLIINNRTFLSPDMVKKQVVRQYEGKVTEINTKGETLRNFSSPGTEDSVTFAVVLKIQGTNKIPYQLYYSQEELQKTKASFDNLKIGDTVRIEETIDFSLPLEQMVIKLLVNRL